MAIEFQITEGEDLMALGSGDGQLINLSKVIVRAPKSLSGSTESDAFGGKTKVIRFTCDVDCYINPNDGDATASHMPFAANSVEYFGVHPEDTIKVIAK